MTLPLPALALVLTLTASWAAAAQTQVQRAQVYRCGPDGRDLRDSPCPGAQAGTPAAAGSTVDYDQPSSADSRAARARHLSDAKQAAALAQGRRASEAEARRQRSTHIGLQAAPIAVAKPASSPQVVLLQPPKVSKPRKPAATDSSAR